MTDLSTKLASWRAGALREAPPKGLLGALERSHKKKEERIRESRTLTPEMKALELSEARRTYREEFRRLRADINAGYEERRATLKRKMNRPPSDQVLGRMATLAQIHVSRWERTPGNIFPDAIGFEEQGDEAGLRLVSQHLGLLPVGQRREMAQLVETALDGFKSAEERKARDELESLDAEQQEFDAGAAARPIAKLYPDIGPAPSGAGVAAVGPTPQR